MNKLILPPAAAAAAQKAKLAENIPAHRCGNCFYASGENVPDPINWVRCEGLPPTPIVIGMNQTPTGQEPQIILYRPNLPANLKACALWSQRDLPGLPTHGTEQ